MSFFEHQESARKRTGWLVLLFVMAVLGIIVSAYLVVAMVLVWSRGHTGTSISRHSTSLLDSSLLAIIGSTVIAMVAGGTLYKLIELRAGGKAVAESLGGKLIEPGLADPPQRKLLNVVEEMALASGTPVPPVYLLPDEAGINAFAAGYTPGDAVIGVTQGAVQRLSRDELQGVIGHEFSHIFNGDMRLNIRLIGTLHGILVIGMVGNIILRSVGGRSGSRSRSGKGNNPLPLIAMGLGLMLVGAVGTVFGKLIKAAVSRQREFLADASSVQFTRNPLGLAGALRKIGGLSRGSLLQAPGAESASHMFFGQGVPSWTGLFATHPGLEERIRRIEPAWDGTFISGVIDTPGDAEPGPGNLAEGAVGIAGGAVAGTPATGTSRRVACVSQLHLQYAARLLKGWPLGVVTAAREPFSARAVVYALLINAEADSRARQMDELERSDPPVAQTVRALLKHIDVMPDEERLPLLDLAMPGLRRLSAAQYRQFQGMVELLVRADGKIQLFEWMVERLVISNLRQEFAKTAPQRARYYGLGQLTRECSMLLSTLARAGSRSGSLARGAFAAGAACLEGVGSSLEFLPAEACRLSELNTTLETLNETAPRLKQQLVNACGATILADAEVTAREAELLRAVSAALNCPIPPLIAGSGEEQEEAASADGGASASR